MNNISNPILKLLKLQMEALIDLNSREDLSEEVRDIWGADRMCESWFGLVRLKVCALTTDVLTFLIAPTIQSHEIRSLWPK